ncbi:hypothetical protein ODJ75_01390 [Streptomyces sp. HB2AG]|nr:hypothetical protein [Streptomyces sp. HB2AG]MCZ2523347.1 hypothetical protein [Streptomyces sp. HB2AG]
MDVTKAPRLHVQVARTRSHSAIVGETVPASTRVLAASIGRPVIITGRAVRLATARPARTLAPAITRVPGR